MSTAAASSGKPACTKSSTARVMRASIISMAAGTMPAAMMADTVAAPSSTDAKSSSRVRTAGGFGREPHGDAGGDAEHALAADEGAAQVEAGRLGIEAAEHRDACRRAAPPRRPARGCW